MSEEDKLKQITLEMAKKINDAIRNGKSADQRALASEPFGAKPMEEKERERIAKLILTPKLAKTAKKKLTAVKTNTFLDYLFYGENNKVLFGIPFGAQIGITGLPDSGKSILMEEIAVQLAGKGAKVLFVTSEDIWESQTPRFDLQSRMIQKAEKLKIVWANVKENLFVMDTVTNSELGDWDVFVQAYKHAIEVNKAKFVIIDSITVLEAYRGSLKYRVAELGRYNQVHGVTALFVNQRAQEKWDEYAMAGGIGMPHMLDGTIIIDYGGYWDNPQIKADYTEVFGEPPKRKQVLRIARVLGCRMCGFNRHYQFIEITKDGFLRIVVPTKAEK